MGIIRILFLADTHLGFDLPFRPRIQRRRRGPEFFANFKRALLMIQLNLHPQDMDAAKFRSYLESTIGELPQDGIVKLRIHGRISQEVMAVLRAASLRSIAPPTMNIDTAFKDFNFF
jgi:hypothetical protein